MCHALVSYVIIIIMITLYSRHIYFMDLAKYGCDVKYINMVSDRMSRVTCVTCHLHLPARGVILPHVQRVVPSLGALVNVDLVLHVVPVLPSAVPRYY